MPRAPLTYIAVIVVGRSTRSLGVTPAATMRRVRLYRNPECAQCARMARADRFLEWLDRFDDTTDVPSTGALALGEIAVQDLRSGKTLKGIGHEKGRAK